MAIRVQARAKVNLCLHVTGQRADGLHLLDSLVVFADCGDRVDVSPADAISLQITGLFGAGLSETDNLVMQAAALFDAPAGVAISLDKQLPVASGIGGGSADAAATLAALAEFWNLPLPDAAAQLSLGADVPVCVYGQPNVMRGVGEEITPLPNWPDLYGVLVNCGVSVSTGTVFGALTDKKNAPLVDAAEAVATADKAIQYLKRQRNDLQASAISAAPEIARVLAVLEDSSAVLARMSGSGATCYGLCETKEAAADMAAQISAQYPDWWVQATQFAGAQD